MRPGSTQRGATTKTFLTVNLPVVCRGVLVESGDVIVADGDKAGRRSLYKKLGLPEDDSVK